MSQVLEHKCAVAAAADDTDAAADDVDAADDVEAVEAALLAILAAPPAGGCIA